MSEQGFPKPQYILSKIIKLSCLLTVFKQLNDVKLNESIMKIKKIFKKERGECECLQQMGIISVR
jgi:hypothetical protein